jgi:REP element-mobilizing transposase RayT
MTYWRLFYHFIWGTKYRQDLIEPYFEPNLYPVLIAKAQDLGAQVYAVGGTENHIHMAASVPPDLSLASFIGQVKGNSAHYINAVIQPEDPFEWQREYGVLSFGGKQLDMVVNYIRHQKEHHAENQTIPALELGIKNKR